MSFTLERRLQCSYEEALARIPEALASEGFGVLTEIDVTGTLKKKLGVDFRKYRILGACNPGLAHQALQVVVEVGALLPCNIVVYESDDGSATVLAVDPLETIAGSDPRLANVAKTVREKLERALARLE